MTDLASRPAALAAASPELVALIAALDHVNSALLDLETLAELGTSTPEAERDLNAAAGALRARLAAFPSRGLPDVLAKAACVARLYPPADIQAEIRPALGGRALLDDMWVGLAVELMRVADGSGFTPDRACPQPVLA
ncbi:hypothetical protein ACU4GR_33800 (plasmid) [Methylobacterium oryzae CBMB20]